MIEDCEAWREVDNPQIESDISQPDRNVIGGNQETLPTQDDEEKWGK